MTCAVGDWCWAAVMLFLHIHNPPRTSRLHWGVRCQDCDGPRLCHRGSTALPLALFGHQQARYSAARPGRQPLVSHRTRRTAERLPGWRRRCAVPPRPPRPPRPGATMGADLRAFGGRAGRKALWVAAWFHLLDGEQAVGADPWWASRSAQNCAAGFGSNPIWGTIVLFWAGDDQAASQVG
jgi:hypothetical protein